MENMAAGMVQTKFILLEKFTEKGIQNVKDTTVRFNQFKAMAEKAGVRVMFVYWTVGQFDVVMGLEGSEESVTAVLLKLNALGNVRTQVLRGFSEEEMQRIVSK